MLAARSFLAPSLVAFALAVSACSSGESALPASDGRREVTIQVGAEGYTPAEFTLAANAPVRLIFTRTTDEGCGQQLVIPALDVRRDLPLNQPVAVDLTMPAEGRLRFTCGMDMYDGTIVVQ
jgi:plastocyanin domain-containing protein